MIKKILIALLVILVIIQFIRPAKNIAATDPSKGISSVYKVPDSVHQVLLKACYDCHSDNTRYPWYANIQPVYWWMNGHINDGKKHLNLDEFAAQTPQKQAKWIRHIYEQIDSNEMPIDSYMWIHKDAILTNDEKTAVSNWAHAIYAQIPDSLKKKKK
jgi:hypothetical protein